MAQEISKRRLLGLAIVLAGAVAVAAAFGRYYAPDAMLPERASPKGYRTVGLDAPTPDEVKALAANESVILIDVMPLSTEERYHLPGSVWLPRAGEGNLSGKEIEQLEANLREISERAKTSKMVFYCKADCWLSWNASKRALSMGFDKVYWYRDGTDGWREKGWPMVAAEQWSVQKEFN